MSVIASPPSSNGEMSRDALDKAQAGQGSSKDNATLSPEEGSSSKKGRGLLNVPSRSSSQRSPTSTGLSGATASDPRDSIGGNSKESKGSMLGRRRNGSASSNRSNADNGRPNTAGNSQPNSTSASQHKKKKGGGLLSLFCCGVPDDANPLENEPENVPSHKVDKLPTRPATASRRTQTPSEQTTGSKTQLNEKDVQPNQNVTDPSKAKRVSGATTGATTQDQLTLAEREPESNPSAPAGNPAPTVTVDPPQSPGVDAGKSSRDVQAVAKDGEGDVEMPDAGVVHDEPQQPIAPESQYQNLPPPPPGPVPIAPSPPAAPVSEGSDIAVPDAPQPKFLLPAIEPHMKGRKCLVLDLDETLVHSSFKVCCPPCRSNRAPAYA